MTLKGLVLLTVSIALALCHEWWHHTEYEWCKYQLCLQKKKWHEARAACKAEKKTLVQISDATHYTYIAELISSSMSLLAGSRSPSIDSELWIDLYVDKEGKQRWGDCETYESQGISIPITFATSGCYVLNTEGITALDCNLEKQFLCKGTVKECFHGTTGGNYFHLMDGDLCRTPIQQPSAECDRECIGYGFKGESYCFYTPAASSVFISNDMYIKPPRIHVLSQPRFTASLFIIMNADTILHLASMEELQGTCSELLYYEDISITNAVHATDLCTKSCDTSSYKETITLTVSSVVKETVTFIFSNVVKETVTFTESAICPTLASNISLFTCSYLNATNVTMTTEELSAEVQKLREDLIVKKDRLSSWKRKLVSAKDDRTSAKGIGYVAVFVLAAVAFLILALDSNRFLSNVKHLKKQMAKQKTKENTLPLPDERTRRRRIFLDDTNC